MLNLSGINRLRSEIKLIIEYQIQVLFCTSIDKFTAVYGDCARSNFRDTNVCGNNAVRKIENTTTIDYFNITNMPVGASCTYKVFANCSWPSFEVNSTEVDLWVTSFKGKKNDKSEADGSTTF